MQYFTSLTRFTITSVSLLALGLALSACAESTDRTTGEKVTDAAGEITAPAAELDKAIFAAGCFWCVEEAFDKLDGVVETTSGFTDGHVANPSYKQVVAGGTGHTEALEVTYDPAKVTYQRLLETFWHNVDATDNGGQFCDRGQGYRSGIYYMNAQQQQAAEASKQALQNDPNAPSPIVVPIEEATPFYAAEEYHQNYHQKNPVRYTFYKTGCGRANRLAELWDDHSF